MLNFAIIEDNEMIMDNISKFFERALKKTETPGKVAAAYSSPKFLLENVNKIDEIANTFILDISLGSKVDGFTLAKLIREHSPDAYIVFLTGQIHYAVKAIDENLMIFDYLVKPVNYDRIEKLVGALNNHHSKRSKANSTTQILKIKVGSKETLLDINSIIYLESSGHKTILHTSSSTYETYASLNKTFEEISNKLLGSNKAFIQVHRSFIVNKDYISYVDYKENYIRTKNELRCPVSESFKKKLRVQLL